MVVFSHPLFQAQNKDSPQVLSLNLLQTEGLNPSESARHDEYQKRMKLLWIRFDDQTCRVLAWEQNVTDFNFTWLKVIDLPLTDNESRYANYHVCAVLLCEWIMLCELINMQINFVVSSLDFINF